MIIITSITIISVLSARMCQWPYIEVPSLICSLGPAELAARGETLGGNLLPSHFHGDNQGRMVILILRDIGYGPL